MEKDKAISPRVNYLILTGLFWLTRLIFIYFNTERTFPCEWRVGSVARELLTHPLLSPHLFLKYTCVGIIDAWQVLEGVALIPFFAAFGSSLFSLKLFAVSLSYLHFCGWYLLAHKYISGTVAAIFGLLFVFSPPFYLEGSLFLVGTQVQANLLIPYIFLLLFSVLKKGKTRSYVFPMIGFLVAAGIYFTWQYYFILFLALFFIFIKKYAFKKETLLFLISLLIFTAPFFSYSFIAKESLLNSSGSGRNGFSALGQIIPRFHQLISRHDELFAYGANEFLGAALFAVFLISSLYALISQRWDNNKLIFTALIYFMILQLGRIFSRFELSHPIGKLFWSGSSRYFIFGFELVLLFIAYFLAAIRGKLVGKLAFSLVLSGFMLSSLSYICSNANIAVFGRKFPPGYSDEDIGNRVFFWCGKNFKTAYFLIEATKKNAADKEGLMKGLIGTAIFYAYADSQGVGSKKIKEFLSVIDNKYKIIFNASLGSGMFLECKKDPKIFFEKLVEIEKQLSREDYRYVLNGLEGSLIFENVDDEKLSEIAGFIDRQGGLYKNNMLELLGGMKSTKCNFLQEGFFAETKSICHFLDKFPENMRESILRGYSQMIVRRTFCGDYGSIYFILRELKKANFPYKKLFVSALIKEYEPIYGEAVTKTMFAS